MYVLKYFNHFETYQRLALVFGVAGGSVRLVAVLFAGECVRVESVFGIFLVGGVLFLYHYELAFREGNFHVGFEISAVCLRVYYVAFAVVFDGEKQLNVNRVFGAPEVGGAFPFSFCKIGVGGDF